MRYVGRYRCEAIQCREDNIRPTYLGCLRQPWIASPHINATYRKCGGGFAKTVRRGAHHGQSGALSRRALYALLTNYDAYGKIITLQRSRS
ncbi:MAG: hypothetical protein LBM98_10710, partial [Oscillospiraceae bacterium]|nr:hypothetical protein [Oscillospiraceae bacterium]